MSSQPNWICRANLGDMSPCEHGAGFVFEDLTGVYAPEMECSFEIESTPNKLKWLVFRFTLEQCTWTNGVLSDNEFHPGKPAWFADTMESIAQHTGATLESFIADITRGTLCERAQAWRAIGEYHGFENLDSYPLVLSQEQIIERYSHERFKVIPESAKLDTVSM